MGDVAVRLGGLDYTGWHAVSVRRGVEQAAGEFSCSVSERAGSGAEPWVLRPGSPCEILLDGELVLTGYVDRYSPSFDAGSHMVEISGRSKTADLVDSSAVVPGGQFKQLSLLDIASRLAAPFGIPVDALAAIGGPLADVQIQQGETVHAVIERLCRLQGLLVSDGPAGLLTLARAGTRRAITPLRQGGNILAGHAELDASQRHSEYVVKGQRANTDDRDDGAGPTIRACVGGALDATVARYRPLLVTAETQVDDLLCKGRAAREARRRAGQAVRASVTVADWRQTPGGPLWAPNLMVAVIAPWLGIDRELLIASVDFRKDDGGSTTTLELTVPDAYAAEEEEAAPGATQSAATPAAPAGGETWGPIERTGATPIGGGDAAWGPIERLGATPTASGGPAPGGHDLWSGGFVSTVANAARDLLGKALG
jgi:prophage tail gpP-like protein